MPVLRSKILRFAIITRLSVIFLQLFFNTIFPDHAANAFSAPLDPNEKISNFDKLISFLFSGLTRWDSEYYLHIAKHGYTYENTLAFLPLYPMTIRTSAIILKKILFFLNFHSVITISAILINFLCFIKSSLILYDLTVIVMNKKIAYRSAILYCISPASIFFTAAYTESMFAYITFYSMLASVEKNRFVSLPIGLSSLVRSNGLINIGFPLYICLQDLISHFSFFLRQSFSKFSKFLLGLKTSLLNLSRIFSIILLSVAPFSLLQTYNYILFCTESGNSPIIPPYVKKYGEDNGLIMPRGGFPPWCHYKIPTAYSYIQKHYWNVGFMNYYEVKQIPNFILAFPIIFIMLKCIYEYLTVNWGQVVSLKVLMLDVEREDCERKDYPAKMFPFIVHGLFLTFFCIFFVHIQVSTRLLASASPLLYWYTAILLSREERDDWDVKNNINSSHNVFFKSKKRWTTEEKIVLAYFVSYTVVGTFMYSNFLPWT
ncbi:GPI mannosyltransferase 2 [Diachasma alloeum]|uniref:GPI mannosyltransferase 2 n=1 Tax=Diachasma alloeum TaxID=454923 RepID=UPI0007382E7E|nr:GPI mannosyltransferase 2 [Diachasma alloeum]XP_015123353.1 GPI mannosyltransferase 2 [Diachasma alloeum]